MLAMATQDYPWDWEDHLCQLCYVYNTLSRDRYMPFFLMFGRQARLPEDLVFQLPQDQLKACPHDKNNEH